MAGVAVVDERVRDVPPRPVVLAVWLMWLGLALGVVTAVVLSADDVGNAFGSDSDEEFGSLIRGVFIAGGVALVAAAALWALLTVRVRQGRNWARVATWVVAVVVAAVTLGFGMTTSGQGFVIATVAVLAALCALLAQPGSNAYFGRSA